MNLSKNIIRKIFKTNITEEEETQAFGKVDLDHLVQEGHDAQTIAEDDLHDIKIFRNALDFSKVKLRECIVPRNEIEAMEINGDISSLKQRFIETGYSRILIYKDSIDNIVGYIHSSVIFKNPQSIKAGLSNIIIVPETMPAHKLLNLFTREHKSVAVVVDEYGGTSGLISLEDIIEEIVGDISDEFDDEDLKYSKLDDNNYVFEGKTALKDFYKIVKIQNEIIFEENKGEAETIAGFVLEISRDFPKLNSKIKFENYVFTIEALDKKRIKLIKFTIKG